MNVERSDIVQGFKKLLPSPLAVPSCLPGPSLPFVLYSKYAFRNIYRNGDKPLLSSL